MIILKKFFIKKYVDKLTIQDIDNFAKSNNIYLDNEELNYMYNLIKTKWLNILSNDETILIEIKNKFNFEKSSKIENLYFEYKNKYKKFFN